VEPPIVLRSIKKGDEILLPGGMTSVKELLAGWKVSAPDREKMPLLADRRGILAVLGGALGYRTRTRVGAIGENLEKADCIEVTTFIDMEEGREQQQR
jgi:tRNA(Ile)-lysidine synthetase-like protein